MRKDSSCFSKKAKRNCPYEVAALLKRKSGDVKCNWKRGEEKRSYEFGVISLRKEELGPNSLLASKNAEAGNVIG